MNEKKFILDKNKIETSYELFANWWNKIDLTNYEKNKLNKEIISFNQQLLRLKERTLRIGAYGKTGVGKSSLLNLILNEPQFHTNILNGSTKNTITKEWNLNHIFLDKVELIDFPGFDSYNRIDKGDDDININNLDLILFVVAGDINRNEAKILDKLITQGHQLIIIFNKIDNWNCSEVESIKNNIKIKLSKYKQIPLLVHSNTKYHLVDKKMGIKDYLIHTFSRIGCNLLIYNTFQLANKLSHHIKQNRLQKNRLKAQTIIGQFAAIKASSVAINPFLFLDIAGSFAFDTILIQKLSDIYGLQIKNNSTKKIIKAISFNNLSLGAVQIAIYSSLNLIKKLSLIAAPFTNGLTLLPYGPIALVQAAVAVSSTKRIGKLAAIEMLNKSKINKSDPFYKIQQIALNEPEIMWSNRIFLYNQRHDNDFSIYSP